MSLKFATLSNFLTKSRHINYSNIRLLSTPSEVQQQNEMFLLEQKRQKEQVGRIEKMEIEVCGFNDAPSLIMNRNISTPYDCAKHINEKVMNNAAVALVNNEVLWHMHKPLPDSCKLEFLHYNHPQPGGVNKAFWRTCSFLLGAVASQAFKDKVDVQLHSFPIPNVKSGSFVHDIQLSLDNWTPKEDELRVLSLEYKKFCQEEHPITCLDVSVDLALLMFEKNPHKTMQIPDIAANNNGKITLFRAGEYIDISKGPMIANTNQVGRITVSNVIKLETDIKGPPIYRFQGVALPHNIILNHFAFSVLEKRAKQLNPARLPGSQGVTTEDNSFIAQAN